MTPAKKLIEIESQPYTLVFNFGMARQAEKELGQPLMSAFQNVAGVSLDALSAVWWASLQNKHRMTREASDALVDVAGMEAVAQWVAEGLTEYFGVSEEKAEPEGNGRKRK